MEPPPAPNESSSRTFIHHPGKKKDSQGPYDALFYAICPQHPGKPRLSGPPEAPSIAVNRKITPIRPVYDDFATAHSSITSGSANSLSKMSSKAVSKTQHDILGPSRPLSRRQHKPFRWEQKSVLSDKVLSPPTHAKVQHKRPISEFDFDVSDMNFTSTRPPKIDFSPGHRIKVSSEKQTPPSPFFGNLRKAFRGKSSPTLKSSKSPVSTSSIWGRDSIELANIPRKRKKRTESQRDHSQTVNQARLGAGNIELFNTSRPDIFDDPFVLQQNQDEALKEAPRNIPIKALHGIQELADDLKCYYSHGSRVNLDCNLHNEISPSSLGTAYHLHSEGSMARATSSMRESSTVDKIVKQYANNRRLWDISLESDDDDDDSLRQIEVRSRVHDGSFLNSYRRSGEDGGNRKSEGLHTLSSTEIREQVRTFKAPNSSGQAPSEALPQVPSQVDHRILEGSPGGHCQTSLYGDTGSLLHITQLSQRVLSGGSPAAVDSKVSWYSPQTPNTMIDRNPYRHALHVGNFNTSSAAADPSPRSASLRNEGLEARSNSNGEDELNVLQLALERNVSSALRRTSACSNFCQNKSTPAQGDGGFQSSTDSSGLLGFIGRHSQRRPKGESSKLKGFYHESAIHQAWLSSQHLERVRIPVNLHGNVSSNLCSALATSFAEDGSDLVGSEQQNEDYNDWETVPESGIANGAVTNIQSFMGQVNRAGSSLAYSSDEGSNGPLIYQHSDFSSTERFIQHPGQIDYSLDYRIRELKDGSFPVLLPSYKQHTVNGFPANSYRSLSPFQQTPGAFYYRHPSPLSRNHTNPFQSPPPENIDVRQRSDEGLGLENMAGNQIPKFKPASYSTELLNKERDDLDRWMNEFDDLGPIMSLGHPEYAEQAISPLGNSISESHKASRTVGSSIADASFSTLDALIDADGHASEQDKTELPRVTYDTVPSPSIHERSPFVKRPPGAFYQGVRSRPDLRRKGLSLDRYKSRKPHPVQLSQPYPTNQMRPLSLLKANPPQVGIEKEECQHDFTQRENFFYRSPLAPVKSRNWRTLYTREQLSLIHNAAKDDGMCDIESQRSQLAHPRLGEDVEANGSWKRIPWSPHMFAWPRVNSSIDSDLTTQKRKISNIVFGLCCLFPPMLVLFGFGYMDNIILWMTKGEITAFGKIQKKVALQVVCFALIATLVAIPVFVLATVLRHV